MLLYKQQRRRLSKQKGEYHLLRSAAKGLQLPARGCGSDCAVDGFNPKPTLAEKHTQPSESEQPNSAKPQTRVGDVHQTSSYLRHTLQRLHHNLFNSRWPCRGGHASVRTRCPPDTVCHAGYTVRAALLGQA